MAALKDKFLEAEGFLSANKIQMTEALKLKLYGLSKQIKEGDCKMPQPPSSNTILRAKWENWMNYSGWPIDKAMNEYVNMVELLKEGTPGGKSNDAPGSIRKSGVLYKQRDVFKGWRARHFSLQDNFLHYSLEADDPVPRDTMDLTGCSVTTSKSVIVDGVEYYPFVITHPKSTKTYNLSSTSKLETDVWVSKILDAASTPIAAPVPQGKVERLLERREPDHDEAAHEDVTSNKNLNNSVLTLANIPKKFSAKLELAMQAMLDAVAPDAQGWEQLFEKNGVKAMKRSGDVICVRGESVMPYCVLDVFEMIMSVERQVEIDPQQRLHEVIRKYSNHTWAEYILFKGVWPTSPRDFTNLIHWRQMTDGTIIIAGFSEKFEDLRPIPDGNVRGELILGGYVIRQHPQGTQVYFVVQTDLKGTLPSSVVNIVSSGQPMIVANIRRLIEQDKKKNGPGRKIDTPTTYQELLAISIKGGGNKPDDVVEISNEDSTKGNSKQVSASQIDRSKVAAAAKAEAAPAAPAAPVKKPKKKAAQENKLNTIALLVLLLPPLLYYAVDRKFRAVAFVGGLLIAYQYLVKLHLGNPVKRPTVPDCTVLPVGRYNFRFPVDLGRLLKFLDSKRNELEMEITLTHVAVKATAMVLFEQTHLKGHVICGDFYLARQPGVDLTVNYEVTATETTVLRIDDADAKPLEYITDEITTKGQAVRAMKSKPGAAAAAAKAAGNYRPQLLAVLPPAISRRVDKFLTYLGSQLGVSVPALGVERFPLGLCTVLTSPNQEGEQDMDIMVVPSIADSATPITVTIGGIRLLPAMDQERKLIGSPSLNFSVSVDSKACSLSDARKFAARLQQFMNEPDLIDKADQNAARLRDDTSKRKSMFG